MTPWTDLTKIPLPHHMRKLPRDPRGYPVPWIALDHKGKADFRVLDTKKVQQALTAKLCSICGKPMHSGEFAFVGGPLSIENRLFNDPAMHPGCAEYALKVCPFLAAPKFAYAKKVKVEGVDIEVSHGVSLDRPDQFGLGVTYAFGLVNFQGEVYIHAAHFHSLTWWQHGHPV